MKNILALLADWANGIFALIAAAYITDTALLWWYVPIALILASLPDIDALPELVRRGKVASSSEHMHDHRTVLHWPLVAIVFGCVVVYVFGFWGYVVLFSVMLHLLNDLYGTGWGIQLFWPLSHRRYKVLGRRVNRLKQMLLEDGDWSRLPAVERKLRLIVTWSPDEFNQYMSRWGVENWIERIYLRLNWITVTEYSLFVVACTVLLRLMT